VKINKILSLLAAAALLSTSLSPAFSAAKRDVNDPVMREIINELAKKMPKFIDRYGETVFVEDEPITRGTLLQAIYEYDKKTKGTAADTPVPVAVVSITRQEFDDLKGKVTALQKQPAAPAKASLDTDSILAEIKPNMPQLLDNSLKSSKVFKDLQQQVAANAKNSGTSAQAASVTQDLNDINARLDNLSQKISGMSAGSTAKGAVQPSQKEIAELKNTLAQIQSNYVALSKRIDEIDSRAAYAGASSAGAADVTNISRQLSEIKKTVADVPTTTDIRKEISRSQSQTQSDINRIEQKLNSMSKGTSSSGSSSSKSGATIATISLGITMIAALFVAR